MRKIESSVGPHRAFLDGLDVSLPEGSLMEQKSLIIADNLWHLAQGWVTLQSVFEDKLRADLIPVYTKRENRQQTMIRQSLAALDPELRAVFGHNVHGYFVNIVFPDGKILYVAGKPVTQTMRGGEQWTSQVS